MYKFISRSIAGLLFVLLFNACSIQKRHHLPGYYVEWNTPLKTKLKATEKTDLSHPEHLDSVTISESHLPNTASKNEVETQKQDSPSLATNGSFKLHETTGPSVLTKKNKIRIPAIQGKLNAFSKQPVNRNFTDKQTASSEDVVKLVLAIVFLALGIFPASVYLMAGKGKEFVLSIILTVLYVACIVAANIILFSYVSLTAATFPVTALLFILGAFIMGILAFIQALMVLLHNI